MTSQRSRSTLRHLVLLSLALAWPAWAQRATLPPRQLARQSNTDIEHIKLDLGFDIAGKAAFGTATIQLAALRRLRVVSLDAANMAIEAISLADGTALQFSYDGSARDDALAITLPRDLKAGEKATLLIRYRTRWVNQADPANIWGSFGKGLRFFAPTTTVPIKRRQIWSMGIGTGNRTWFPGRDDPGDLRTTDVIATVPAPLMAISNGDLLSVTEADGGLRRFHWRMNTPYPNALTSIAVGEYTDVEQATEGVGLHTYAYPDERDAAIATVDRLPEMLRYFSKLTGVRYPWQRYSMVMGQDLGGGVPFGLVSTMTDNFIDDGRTHADFLYLWDNVEADALAYQWSGVAIMPKSWRDAWLGASLAHHMGGLFSEHRNGRDEYLMWQVLADQGTVLGDWRSGNRRPIVTDRYTDPADMVSDNHALFRGSLVLHMLRHELGDDVWRRALARYAQYAKGRQVTTADFEAQVSAVAGRPLTWFFDQWLHRIGHPQFEVSQRHDPGTGELVLDIRQTQQPDPASPWPQVQWFAGAMDIGIDNRLHRIRIEPGPQTTVRLPAATAPKLVSFDVGSTWIKAVSFSKSLPELLYQLEHDRDVTGQRWAMDEAMARAMAKDAAPADREALQAALVRVISGPSYWRLRSTAISNLRTLLLPAGVGAVKMDGATRAVLVTAATRDAPWVRTGAIRLLGATRDPALADLYLRALDDVSDRVINVAAIALGQTGDPRAYERLVTLIEKPSWKSQSLISALQGMAALGDPRGIDVAVQALENRTLPRWWLATSVWDYRLAAAETLVALKAADRGFPIILSRLEAALAEDDINDIFGNAQLIATLGDVRGRAALDLIKGKFANDGNAMNALEQYRRQLEAAIAANAKP